MLAISDEDIINEGLGVKVNEKEQEINKEFYKGELVSDEEVLTLINDKDLLSINAIGKEIINLLISKGIVKKEEVKEVNGFPHILIFFI